MSSNYWSSTTNANNTNNAWHVNFNNGNVNNNNKSNSYYVRAVRFGKCELFSFASLYQAYLDCRKRKRGTVNALRFEFDLLENLAQLALEIQQGSYRPSRSVCFVTTRPKLREIFAADFRDRIVHHLVVRELETIYEPQFIHDSFASRKNKGTHAAVRRLQRFMWSATRNMKMPAWYLQLDIRSFFMSINKQTLFTILERDLARHLDPTMSSGLLYLLHRIIFHDCTEDYRFKGDPTALEQVPSHKSLFACAREKGLPIGNLTSQFLSNIYLNELDQFIKHRLKCRYYIRYVDDFVLISQEENQLILWRDAIKSFLRQALSLELKSQGVLRRVADGLDFLGYIVRPRYILARRRVVNNLKTRLSHYERLLLTYLVINQRPCIRFHMAPEIVTALRQTLSSYLGHFKHADTFHLLKSLWSEHAWLAEYFFLNGDLLLDRFKHRGVFRSLKCQIHFFRYRFGQGVTLLVRVGKFYELYGTDTSKISSLLGLKVNRDLRKGVLSSGFPAWMLERFMERILYAGKSVAVIEEYGPGRFVVDRYVDTYTRFGGLRCGT